MAITVLIVDDESACRKLLGADLESEGFAWRSASSGEEALDMLEKEPFEVILSDLQMPGISGFALLQEIRRKHQGTAFVMVTGVDDLRLGIQAMRQGAADYLVKPFRRAEVVAGVRRALEQKRMEIEIENYRQHLEEMVSQRTHELQAAMTCIEQTYENSLETLAAALDLRDTETQGHSRRVSRYALEVGKTCGCSDEQLKDIARGAYLHDVGKIGIPDAILLKGGKLGAEERAVMRAHVRIGYELVSRIAFLMPAAEIVLTHHERYDGSGYPRGLRGEDIPLGSRIFALADALDALTSDRPYRGALPLSAAREEIEIQAGRQFDPVVVRAFLSIPENVLEKIRLSGVGTLGFTAVGPSGLGGLVWPTVLTETGVPEILPVQMAREDAGLAHCAARPVASVSGRLSR